MFLLVKAVTVTHLPTLKHGEFIPTEQEQKHIKKTCIYERARHKKAP